MQRFAVAMMVRSPDGVGVGGAVGSRRSAPRDALARQQVRERDQAKAVTGSARKSRRETVCSLPHRIYLAGRMASVYIHKLVTA